MIQCPSSPTMAQMENCEIIFKTILGKWRNRGVVLYLLKIIWRSFSHGLVTHVFESDYIQSPREKYYLRWWLTWYCLHGISFTGIQNARVMGSWMLPARFWQMHGRLGICISFDQLLGYNDMVAYEAVSMKRMFQWRPENIGYGRNMEHLPRKTIAINTMASVRKLKYIRTHVLITCVLRTGHKATGFKDYSIEFWSFLVKLFLFMIPLLSVECEYSLSTLLFSYFFFFLRYSESRMVLYLSGYSYHLDIWMELICFLKFCI